MHDALRGLSEFCDVYLGDIIVFSKLVSEHLVYIRAVLQRLRDKQLQVKRPKCSFLRSSVWLLRHVVLAAGVAPDPSKVEAISDLAPPYDVPTL